MRICSLIPGATEIVAALGLADHLVGISHECDFPASIAHVPVMIEPLVGREPALSADIDQQVKAVAAAGQRLYRLHEGAFHDARPDLILAQDLCHVCAVTPDQLNRAIESLTHRPVIVSLHPTSLKDMLVDIERIARAVGKVEEGRALADALGRRLDIVRSRAETRHPRPRVVCLEWLAPLYLAGHWVPEMVELAGGQDVLGSKGAPSRETTWEEVEEARPDVVLVMPCGYAINRTLEELSRPGGVNEDWTRAVNRWPQMYVVNAAAHFSRPGPRLIDGVEVVAAILDPDRHHPLDPGTAKRLDAAALGTGAR